MKIFQVDAFTDTAFQGNPAGVHVSKDPLSVQLMQNIAMEMNLAETAFVYTENDTYVIRFFTPLTEVDICGHATLSAAHIMYTTGLVADHIPIEFRSKAGPLSVHKQNDWYTLNFPIYKSKSAEDLLGFIRDTCIEAVELYKSSNGWYIAILEDEESVRQCRPDLAEILELKIPPVFITAKATTPDLDYVMRLFAPTLGIPEDPVTGSAECVLAPIWAEKLGKQQFVVKQLSSRTGIKKVEIDGDRVLISGQALTIFELELKAKLQS